MCHSNKSICDDNQVSAIGTNLVINTGICAAWVCDVGYESVAKWD